MFVVREKRCPQARVMQSYSGMHKMHVSLANPQTDDFLYVPDGHQMTFRLTPVCKENSPSKSSPVTGLEWPGGIQEVKFPRFLDSATGW
jgi:hypothetical protein